MTTFKIKTYGKTELAKLYFPELSPPSAYKRLARKIAATPQLRSQLNETQKVRRRWYFFPKEVRRIVEALGAPEEDL